MFFLRKYYFTLLAAIMLSPSVYSHSRDSLFAKRFHVISFTPQYLINNGLCVNYEFRARNNHFIETSFTGYYSKYNFWNKNFDALKGFSIEANHKIYLSDLYDVFRGLYISYGMGYGYYNIDYTFKEYNDYGTGYGSYSTKNIYHETTIINSLTLKSNIGIQKIYYKRIIVEYYLGVGTRKALRNYSGHEIRFNANMHDYGYSGNVFFLGIKLGLLI